MSFETIEVWKGEVLAMTSGQKKRLLEAKVAAALENKLAKSATRSPAQNKAQSDLYLRTSYLMTSSSFARSLPKDTRKRKAGRSDSIRSMGFEEYYAFNLQALSRSAPLACRRSTGRGTAAGTV